MRSQDEFAKTAIDSHCALRNSASAMSQDLIQMIKDGLARPGKTQRKLAEALKIDDSAVSRILKGTRQIKATELPVMIRYLEAPEPALDARNEPMPVIGLREASAPHDFGAMPIDVPIMGVTVGGSDGEFEMNMGEPADYARRPRTIARSMKVFALYVQGSSMSRWRDPGTLVYVDPIRPPRPGDRVVVELHPEREGGGHPAYLKELVTSTATKVRLRQYNPEGTIEIALSKVRHIHRVIEWEELLGI